MFLGALNQTFSMWKDLTVTLLVRWGSFPCIDPSDIYQCTASAAGTDMYISSPYSFKDICYIHVLIPALEALSVLEFKDQFKIS